MQEGRKRTARTLAAAALMVLAIRAGKADAYPKYDDGYGVGCVTCHPQFQQVGSLHNSHVLNFGIQKGGPIQTSRCNVCHTSGGGTTPVYTMGSNGGNNYEGGGLGCAGCHGQDYGETAGSLMGPSEAGPYNGEPKASGYGLRLVHANAGITVCAGCHPANPNPVKDESVNPPYYPMHISSVLRNACDSAQEDLPFDGDSVGLDNDGNGFADYSADTNCPLPTTTTTTSTTTTTTLPVACAVSPLPSCTGSAKAKLTISEKAAGKENLKFLASGIMNATAQSDWGNPVASDTSYALCVYNGSNVLAGAYEVSRGSDTCSSAPCWMNFKTEGYAYADSTSAADGISKIQLAGGDAGKGKIMLLGKNSTAHLPTGVTAALNGSASAIAQFITSDGGCYGGTLSTVKAADGSAFSASAP